METEKSPLHVLIIGGGIGGLCLAQGLKKYGTSATGDLLVGADGTNSVIRALIAPDARIDNLHYAIYGKHQTKSGNLWKSHDFLQVTSGSRFSNISAFPHILKEKVQTTY